MKSLRKLCDRIGESILSREATSAAKLELAKRVIGVMFIVLCIALANGMYEMISRWVRLLGR